LSFLAAASILRFVVNFNNPTEQLRFETMNV